MDYNDRQAIEGLFGKLSHVESQSGPRDAEADAFIRDRIAAQPGAPYFMAQTIVVQEQALSEAQARIEQLEHQLASRPASGGGFFSSLFGSTAQPAAQRSQPRGMAAPPSAMPAQPQAGPRNPWGQQAPGYGQAPGQSFGQGYGQPARGGGFLAGAAQTAMGVAGGVLLGNAIAGMLGGDEAQAAEDPAASDTGAEDMGAEDMGMEDESFF
ncbi:DUF2076 domain-containing protein [Rhizobium sp. CSW-27]|uniref:DUF2076 domain-containing protein n=1 Tax=Rhizobium sp. CSW-27 TaxID=2839985 RepID=UPI001C00E256|nr:DUF2076 domain-containing protein [Rhizobium sp. CSW-27]MBT9370611.1 DUF2076 domain-containing protein [Rhizobium sp. CSW-27]